MLWPSPVKTPATDPWPEPEPPGILEEAEPAPIEAPEPIKEETLLEKYKRMDGLHGGQCVEFIQKQLRVYGMRPDFKGVAGKIKPNATEPKIGGVVITSEGSVGHVALIVDMTENYLTLAESNMTKNDEIIRVGRQLKKDSERIIGYFNF